MKESLNKIYDIAVIGAGAAGCLAAVRAGQCGKNTVLIEKNNSIGSKILLTGKGRCNVTNSASIGDFMDKFGQQGLFLRSAFNTFSNRDLMEYFESNGLKLKTERQGRVFPVTDSAGSVVEILNKSVIENNIKIFYATSLAGVEKKADFFLLELVKGSAAKAKLKARKLILTTGGLSFKKTGSTGDGFALAKKLGHTITALLPGLVPLKTKELWVRDVRGLALRNVKLTFTQGRKKITSPIGELIFTHFGISGPLVLDLSAKIVHLLKEKSGVGLSLDLKPGLSDEQLEKRLLNDIVVNGKMILKNALKDLLPANLIPVFILLSGLEHDKKLNQLTQKERSIIRHYLKHLPLTVTGALRMEDAMVTCGGVSTKEINPKTMESKIVPGLFFAGELIDGAAPSGGYNLQQAFSTGYLAGESAAYA